MSGRTIAPRGTVYLYHIDPPFGHCRHVVGFTTNLTHRHGEHMRGQGAPIIRHALRTGHHVTLARTWTAVSQDLEMFIKHRYKDTRSLCPLCDQHSDRHLPDSRARTVQGWFTHRRK